MLPTSLDNDWGRHLIEVKQCTPEWLRYTFFKKVREMATVARNGGGNHMHGKTMIAAFDQPSLRTKVFFQRAMTILGGTVISADQITHFSDVVSGGEFKDTIHALMALCPSVIVLRHSEQSRVHEAARILTEERSKAVLINAGDGADGQHPTQALADVFTIHYKFKGRGGLRIAVTGNLSGNRAVNSFVYLMAKGPPVEFIFVSPKSEEGRGRIDEKIREYLNKHHVAFTEETDLEKVVKLADVFYVVNTNDPKIDPKAAEKCHINMGLVLSMKHDAIIMDPLPRSKIEIPLEVDKNKRAVYQGVQLKCGLWVKMALLVLMLSHKR